MQTEQRVHAVEGEAAAEDALPGSAATLIFIIGGAKVEGLVEGEPPTTPTHCAASTCPELSPGPELPAARPVIPAAQQCSPTTQPTLSEIDKSE